MSFGYLEKSKKGLPRSKNCNSSIFKDDSNFLRKKNRSSIIERKKESAFNMQKIYIYGFWEIIIKPLTTEKEDMIERGGV